jgi:flagellar motor switch/type III secretory pathway protein FliN
MASDNHLLDRVTIPTRVVVHRARMTSAALAQVARTGSYAPPGTAGESVCELEAGGQVVARGRIVRRRGGFFFKVLEIGEEA